MTWLTQRLEVFFFTEQALYILIPSDEPNLGINDRGDVIYLYLLLRHSSVTFST